MPTLTSIVIAIVVVLGSAVAADADSRPAADVSLGADRADRVRANLRVEADLDANLDVGADLDVGAGPYEMARAQPPAQPQDEFVPIDQLPPQDQLPAAPLLIAAYAAVMLGLFGYLLSVARRLTAVQREIARLESEIKRGTRT